MFYDGTSQAKEVDDTCRSISEVAQWSWSQVRVDTALSTPDFYLLLCWRLLHHPIYGEVLLPHIFSSAVLWFFYCGRWARMFEEFMSSFFRHIFIVDVNHCM
jgi:hypothetical protein